MLKSLVSQQSAHISKSHQIPSSLSLYLPPDLYASHSSFLSSPSLSAPHQLMASSVSLHALPKSRQYTSLYLLFQKLLSLLGRKEWLHAIFPHPSHIVAIVQHTLISVWIANCYSASTVNSGCLGQACSKKRSLLSIFLKINNQRKAKVKNSSCPKETSASPWKTSKIEW